MFRFLLYFQFFAFSAVHSQQFVQAAERSEACAIDILFVLDSSSSVTGEFERMKDFVVELGKLLVVSPEGHRVALLEFSGLAAKWPQYPFGFVDTTDAFVEALKNMRNLRGTTYLGKALQIASEMLESRNKAIKTLVFVVTDGFSFDEVKPIADKINKMDNIVTIAAGVPNSVSMNSLVDITGDENRVVVNPDVLNKAKSLLTKFLFQCDVRFTRAPKVHTTSAPQQTTASTTLPPTTTTGSFISGCELDLMLIVDFSGSVNPLFKNYVAMCSQLIKLLKIGKFFTRVALIQFASKHRTELTFPFNKTFTKEGVQKQIDNLEYTGGTTNTQAALTLASSSFGLDNGGRPGLAKQVALFFSDGFSQFDPTEAAKSLRDKGIQVYAAASASTIPGQNQNNEEELKNIAGQADRVFLGNDFDKLVKEITRLSNTCTVQ